MCFLVVHNHILACVFQYLRPFLFQHRPLKNLHMIIGELFLDSFGLVSGIQLHVNTNKRPIVLCSHQGSRI